MQTVIDPHEVMQSLKYIKNAVMVSSYLCDVIDSLIADCRQLLKESHKFCRKLHQDVQRGLYEKNYDKLISAVEEFIKYYPIGSIAQNAVSVMNKILPYCDGELFHAMVKVYGSFQARTPDNGLHTVIMLPLLKLYIKELNLITSALQKGSLEIELAYQWCMSDMPKEFKSAYDNYLMKLQEISLFIASLTIKSLAIACSMHYIVNCDTIKVYTCKYFLLFYTTYSLYIYIFSCIFYYSYIY